MSRKNLVNNNTCAIYIRYSSSNQRAESGEAQERACKAFAKGKGFEVVGRYQDLEQTGTSTENRKDFLRMIEDSKEGKFAYVLVYKLDRFARNRYDSIIYKRKLNQNGVELLSVVENLDGSPESVIIGMAEFYSKNLAREVMKGMKESAYKCTHLGGTPPLGYNVDPITKKYLINEDEAYIVQKIFVMYSKGIGYKQILAQLNGLGYKTKKGKDFGVNSIYTILKNEKYTGIYVFNRKIERDCMGRRSPSLKTEEVVRIEGGMPQIIDKVTFDKVQEQMSQNKQKAGRGKATTNYLLTGMIMCGECGGAMMGNTKWAGRNKTKYSTYRCQNRAQHKEKCTNKEIRKEYIEEFLLTQVQYALLNEDIFPKLMEVLESKFEEEKVGRQKELKQVEKAISTLEEKISSVIHLATTGINSSILAKEIEKLDNQKKSLQERRMGILNKSQEVINIEKAKANIGSINEFVNRGNVLQCQHFLQEFIERIKVYDENIEIRFK